MRNSNNAIKFLLAQYRAIFKRAYIKGIASAVLLTAGLAAGQAQAADTQFQGYTNGITHGWADGTTKYAQFTKDNIGNALNALSNLTSSNMGQIPNAADVMGGAITNYSGGALSYSPNPEDQVFNILTPTIKHLNIVGATNTAPNADGSGLVLTSNVNGKTLTVGNGGDLALNIERATLSSGGTHHTGGGLFAGMAMSYQNTVSDKESPSSVSVTNSTLNVKDNYYANDAVIAGYAVHDKSGTASVSGNTLDYSSNNVKQAANTFYESGRIGIPSTMLAGGYARSAGGSADAKTNLLILKGKDTDTLTDITAKSYFGGGYATLYELASTSKTNNSVEASGNTAQLTNLSYDAESNTGKEAFIFGGIAKNQATSAANIKAGEATASNNELTLTDVAITTQATDTSVSIYGGAAINSSLSEGTTGSSTVKASGNKLTIDAKAAKGTAIDMSTVTAADKGATIVGGLAQQTSGDKDVTVEASNNTLTIQGNVKLTDVDLYAGRAVNSVTAAKSGGVTTAVGNVLKVTGNAVLQDTSIIAAAVTGVDATSEDDTNKIIHEGNKAIVDSGVVVIATDSKTVNIAGDESEIKGSVWAKTGGTVTVSGIIKEAELPTSNTFFTGTGTLTGTIYNQGTINVHNELDISQGKIYALADKAVIHVDGAKSKFADSDVDPMDEGYATLKTTEQQIKDYLTADSATNITLPVENKGDTPTKVDESSAGMLKVSSGGTVDFGTSVTLSNFNFNDADTAGAIVVQTSNSDAYFKASTINVEHALAKDATTQTDVSKLTAADASQVHLVANTLNLGSATLTSANSEDITFADATFRDRLSFTALAKGETATGEINDGYHLVATVIGDHYKLLQEQGTNLEDTGTPRYEALSGIIEGDSTIKGTSGSITIRNGNFTADGALTMASGGNIKVGGDDGITETGAGVASEHSPDATLVLGQELTFDLSDGSSSVTVEGAKDGRYDAEYAAESYGDDRYTMLDLRQGVTVLKDADHTIGGAATLEVKSGGEILLTGSNLTSLLAQNNADSTLNDASGSVFKASAGGAFVVEGDIDATFDDFNNGSAAKHGISLKDGGYLVADSLTIDNSNDTKIETSTPEADYKDFKTVDWGNGTVIVQDLEISDLQLTTGDNKPADEAYASYVTLAQGTAQVGSSLLSYNHTLKLGGTNSGSIIFETADAKAEGAINVDHIQVDKGSISATNGVWNGTNTDVTLSGTDTALSVIGSFDNERAASLTLNNIDMVGTGSNVTVGEAGTLKANKLTASENSNLTVKAYGSAEFNQVDFSLLGSADASDLTVDAAVSIRGDLKINGDANATVGTGEQATADERNGVHFGEADSIRIFKNGSLEFGKAAVDGAILDTTKATRFTGANSITLQDDYSKITNQGGILKLDFASGTAFDNESVKALKNALFTSGSFENGVLKDGGILHIGSGSFTYLEGKLTELTGEGLDGWTGAWSDLKQFSDINSDVANYQTLKTNVSGIKVGEAVKGNWGSLSMEPNVGDKAQVILDGHTTLNYAAGNNGFFISDSTRQNALGAKVAGHRTFKLIDGGKIGTVSLSAAEPVNSHELEQETVLEVTSSADNTNPALTTIAEIKGEGAGTDHFAQDTVVNFRANTEVTNGITGIEDVIAFTGADVKIKNTTAVGELSTENGTITVTETAQFGNSYVLGGSITAQDAEMRDDLDQSSDGDEIIVAHNGLFKVNDTLTAHAGASIQVGIDTSWWSEEDLTLEDGSLAGGTGYFEVGTLELNKGTLIVDPEYTEATSIAAVGKFHDQAQRTSIKYDNYKGQLDGDLLIGKNAAFGLGATVEETQAAIAEFQVGNALNPEKYGSILYLNGQMDVEAGSHIALNSSDKVASEEEIKDVNIYNVAQEDAETGSITIDRYAALGLGANTAIIMTNQAFEDDKGEKTGTAIYFNRTNAVVNGLGGEIVLAGDFDLSDKLNIFQDKDAAGQEGVDVKGEIKVKTLNGFLYTTLKGDNQGYQVNLEVNKPEAYGIMSEASDPVVETLIAYGVGVTGGSLSEGADQGTDTPADNPADTPAADKGAGTQGNGTAQVAARVTTEPETIAEPAPEADPAPETQTAAKSSFLERVIVNTHGAPAEQAARLGVYGGAAQVGLAAAGSNSDVLESRFGIGANAHSLNLASNGMGGTLWVAPIYKSSDSDDFGAQGLNYGVDFDLYGVALGGDYKVTNEITVGAMFNVGSGSLDGQGNAAAAGTSNDFDYFGFALYGAYQAGALTVTGDLSYTQVDNDLEGSNEVGKLTASSDTSAWSLGVTGQYKFSFAAVDVTPHAGLRFTSLDLDDYSLEAAGYGNVANYDGDTLSVFSIPVGVTFAKTIEGESWNVTPALDLHVTGQFGDDEAEGSVAWTGTNLSTNVSSEIFDSFTYGATVGVQAESNSFSFGVGLGYTGSSNTDEFSAQANARFTF